MYIKEVLKVGNELLKEANIDTSVLETEVILCCILNCNRINLYINSE